MRKIGRLVDSETKVLFPIGQPLLGQEDRLDLGIETYDRDLSAPREKKRASQHPPGFRIGDPGAHAPRESEHEAANEAGKHG